MYHPTTRLLTILELLQAHPALTGAELARRLEVQPRTVRRYITMLQDMGMPIEATHGPGGGYGLRPGFKLPPLLFTEEEATALVFGLLSTQRLEIDLPVPAVEGALAKVLRVLPLQARERMDAIAASLMLSPHDQATGPDVGVLIRLSSAVVQHRLVEIDYCDRDGAFTRRTVEPYGLAGWWGYWYLVGYCRLRRGFRSFRLDRLEDAQVLAETFAPAPDFDYQRYVWEHLGRVTTRWSIRVEFFADLRTVQQKIPAQYGPLTVTDTGVLLSSHHDDLASTAHFLLALNLPFVVHEPAELRDALRALAERALQSAAPPPEYRVTGGIIGA